jgi:flagellar hook-associated protein 3 FlgL
MQVDPNYASTLAAAIAQSTAQEQTLTSELSSGLRVSSLSADSVAASANVGLAGSISQLDSFVQTSTTEQGLLQVASTTLGQVVSEVASAISLATEGANGVLNSAQLASMAQQSSAIRDNVLSLANTSYQGNYIFSGSQGNTEPFTLDNTTTPATATYQGDALTNSIQTPAGQIVTVNVPGSAIFSAPGTNLLGALNQLVADLQSGDTTAVGTDAAALTSSLDNVNSQRSVLDTSLKQLTDNSTYAQTQAALLEAQQTTLLQADPATVATSLQTAEVQHQALISVASSLDQTDLFSYLK